MRKINLKYVKTFITVCKYMNYHKASDQLFLSASAIHRQIALLEEEIGIKLFQKKGAHIQLSEKGRECLEIFKELVESVENFKSEINDIKDIKHPIKIQMSSYIATYLFPEFLSNFSSNLQRGISISIEKEDKRIFESLLENTNDVVISRVAPSNEMRLQTRKICEGKFVLAAPLVPTLLSESECFNFYRVQYSPYPSFWNNLSIQIEELYPNTKFNMIDDISLIEYLIEENKGISFLPEYVIKKNKSQKIKIIPLKYLDAPTSHTYITWKNTKNKDIKQFIDAFSTFIETQK